MKAITAMRGTVEQGDDHLGVGLMHQHQPSDNRVEGSVRRGGKVRCFNRTLVKPRSFTRRVAAST
jgi:hypothetical protein